MQAKVHRLSHFLLKFSRLRLSVVFLIRRLIYTRLTIANQTISGAFILNSWQCFTNSLMGIFIWCSIRMPLMPRILNRWSIFSSFFLQRDTQICLADVWRSSSWCQLDTSMCVLYVLLFIIKRMVLLCTHLIRVVDGPTFWLLEQQILVPRQSLRVIFDWSRVAPISNRFLESFISKAKRI